MGTTPSINAEVTWNLPFFRISSNVKQVHKQYNIEKKSELFTA